MVHMRVTVLFAVAVALGIACAAAAAESAPPAIHLPLDTAGVRFVNAAGRPFDVLSRDGVCHRCLPLPLRLGLKPDPDKPTEYVAVDTRWPFAIEFHAPLPSLRTCTVKSKEGPQRAVSLTQLGVVVSVATADVHTTYTYLGFDGAVVTSASYNQLLAHSPAALRRRQQSPWLPPRDDADMMTVPGGCGVGVGAHPEAATASTTTTTTTTAAAATMTAAATTAAAAAAHGRHGVLLDQGRRVRQAAAAARRQNGDDDDDEDDDDDDVLAKPLLWLERHYQTHRYYTVTVTHDTVHGLRATVVADTAGTNPALSPVYAALVVCSVLFLSWHSARLLRRRRSTDAFLHDEVRISRLLAAPSAGSPLAASTPMTFRDGGSAVVDVVGGGGGGGSGGGGNSSGSDSDKRDMALPSQLSSSRLQSIDAFRGFALAIMIFVNYGGGGYWFFTHSTWNGLTLADLVFPWFIWIMGVSMVISLDSQRRKRTPLRRQLLAVCRRSAILFALGLFVNNGAEFDEWRIPGVLQRFGVSYLCCALIILLVPASVTPPSPDSSSSQSSSLFGADASSSLSPYDDYGSSGSVRGRGRGLGGGLFVDVIGYGWQWLVIALFVTLWLCLTFLLHVPGCTTGYLGPGGLADMGRHIGDLSNGMGCTGGAAGYIDRKVFGLKHIFNVPTSYFPYKTNRYDPEGLLGCLTSVLMVFLGAQAGRTYLHFRRHPTASTQMTRRWLAWSVLLCVITLALTKGGTRDDGVIPVCKNLWSLSFITATASMAFALLTFFYYTIDVVPVWNGAPWRYAGMNSILIYMGSETLRPYFPFTINVNHNEHWPWLCESLIGTATWLVIAFMMFRRTFFVKI